MAWLPPAWACEYALHGLRLVAAVVLALFVAYRLELDNAFWAGITAAIACQPSLGSSMQKGRVRLVGTVIGAIATIVLVAAMPQSRGGMFVGLALWIGLCGGAATVVRDMGSYGAAVAGFTAAVLFADVVADPDQVFLLAFARTSEIAVGIASAVLVLIATDFGTARRRLAEAFAHTTRAVALGLAELLAEGTEDVTTRDDRRRLIGEIVALDGLIHEAMGESSDLRDRVRTLYGGIEGLFCAISAWRSMAKHVARLGTAALGLEQSAAAAVMRSLAASDWGADPVAVRRKCADEACRMMTIPANDPASRFTLDQMYYGLSGLGRAANALCLAVVPGSERRPRHGATVMLPDTLPVLVNGARAFAAVLTAELFWAASEWSGGQAIVIFAAASVTLYSPLGDHAYRNTLNYLAGTIAALILATLCNFCALPAATDFLGFSLALACVLLPLGALSAAPRYKAFAATAAVNFLAILAPQDQPSYDLAAFLNNGVAVTAGTILACFWMALLPTIPANWQTRRLLGLSLRDLRRLAVSRRWLSRADWTSLISCRLAAMPATAPQEQLSQLIAALSSGEAVIQLRDWRETFVGTDRLDRALAALGAGDIPGTRYWLADFVAVLSHSEASGSLAALRGQAAASVVRDALASHPAFFADAPWLRGPGRFGFPPIA
ncbi:MAG TPA: FUSC family protein [Acetobacteraceae bacterium]|nr:FUSC family protein [Acetobacteraceae bacterium]